MRLRTSAWTPSLAGWVAGAAALPAAAYALVAGRMYMPPHHAHILLVGVAGLAAAIAATALTVAGTRRHDGRAVLLGIAFTAMAGLLVIHALATPGELIGMNSAVQAAGALNLPVGGILLALSALPALRRPGRLPLLRRMQAALLVALAAAGAVALAFPGLIPVLPGSGSLAAHGVFAAGAAPLLLLLWRAGRTYVLTRRAADLAVTIGIVWLIGAQYGLLEFTAMDAAFYAAHGFEIAGIALVGLPAALDLRTGGASRPLVGDLRAGELVADAEAFLGARVRSLMLRLAEKDPSTAGHTRRVATLGVQIGEQLGLPAARLRVMAVGGLLHDMGKLRVPDAVLKKPGPLDDDEFAVIRRHPTWGRQLLTELGGFSAQVLALVEGHHERLDGAGYPNGLGGADLDLELRILAVADVYDALTAERVYREAWPAERALALLEAEVGTAFDGRCVDALRDVLEAPPAFEATVGAPAPAAAPAPRPAPAARRG
jgi:HD-GYP domain-containing protein (c-di-GMP phosphodiesterase class II)